MLKSWFAALAAGLLLAAPARAAPVDSGHVVAELGVQGEAVPGGTIYLALSQKIAKGWHTYWRNPGDSGEATTAVWTVPAGWSVGEFVWPEPGRLPLGPLMNYGFEGEVLLPAPIVVPVDARPGETVSIRAGVTFLVCSDICIPESAALSLDVPVAAGTPAPDPRWSGPIQKALADAPKAAGLKGAARLDGEALRLAFAGAPLAGGDFPRAYFYPYDGTVIDHARPQAIERGPEGLTLTAAPGYAFKGGEAPEVLVGVLSLGGRAYEVEAPLGAPPPAGASGLGPPAPAGAGADLGLPLAVLFAFLGGAILNLMPCVFPILSMKAAALAGHAHEPRAARVQGLAFLGGVMATFLVLAGALILAREAGAAVGWGFQLQSPAVVGALALLMLLVALNLSGVFEVGQGVQGAAGGVGRTDRAGAAGAFLTGVLAVAVAAPCTAPFMAVALGFALTQPALLSLLVFAALGLGFAAPFALLAFAPSLLRRLPRPGAWMQRLRGALAFPMYGTAAWLVWVFSLQAGPAGLAFLLAAGVVLALAAWLFGAAQVARLAGGRPLAFGGASAFALALAVGLAFGGARLGAPPAAAAPGEGEAESASLAAEPFSPERLAELRAEGRPVLVNFTAAWCVTCQVNERVALSTRPVAEAMQRLDVVYLKADWTNRDAVIARTLQAQGRAGVPLYLLYGKDGGEPSTLPQLLTSGGVVAALEKAAS